MAPAAAPGPHSRAPRPSAHQVGHLAWRLVTLAAAISYVLLSLEAGVVAVRVLRGVIHTDMTFVPYNSHVLPGVVGAGAIRASPLVRDALGGRTDPRDDALFLVSATERSFNGCGSAGYNTHIYSNAYMRQMLEDVTAGTAHNLTFLAALELIVPVVDCTFEGLSGGDDAVSRVHYLVRRRDDPEALALLTLTISVQDFQLPDEHQNAATAIGVLTLVDDVRAPSVAFYHVARLGFPYLASTFEPCAFLGADAESFWRLETVPAPNATAATRSFRTASRTGFYDTAETEQSNVKNLLWALGEEPVAAMSHLRWRGNVVVRNSWAWVHGLHFLFAADTLFNLVVLVLVVYRNLRKRKFWMGDAFVSVTSNVELRGLLILVSWYVDGFWILTEFCLVDGNALGTVTRIFAFPEIMRADLLTLYMALAGLAGRLFRERVDPALVVFTFRLGFEHRRAIAQWFLATKRASLAVATADHMKGLVGRLPKYEAVSPYILWSIHPVSRLDAKAVTATLWPVFASFIVIVVFVLARKAYRRVFPDAKIVWSKVTGSTGTTTSPASEAGGSSASSTWKSSFTMFEIATGAPLQNRVGLASDYDNCIYFKGMKFASPDGVYCNGFVIMAGKYLVRTEDVLSIAIIVLVRFRFRTVYVYEVTGSKVQQTARLLYPEMLKLRDLFHLDISILS